MYLNDNALGRLSGARPERKYPNAAVWKRSQRLGDAIRAHNRSERTTRGNALGPDREPRRQRAIVMRRVCAIVVRRTLAVWTMKRWIAEDMVVVASHV